VTYEELAKRHSSDKWCKGCEKWLPKTEEHFYIRVKELKSGRISKTAEGQCKPCTRKKARARIKEGYKPVSPDLDRELYTNRTKLKHTGPSGLYRFVFCQWKPTQICRGSRYARISGV